MGAKVGVYGWPHQHKKEQGIEMGKPKYAMCHCDLKPVGFNPAHPSCPQSLNTLSNIQ